MPASRVMPAIPKASRCHQARSQRTEQVLIDASLGLFLARGVDAVTVAEIAAVAGVAPATIYRRFGDKEGLLKETFRHFTDHALKMIESVPSSQPGRSFVSLIADVSVLVLRFSQANQRLLQSAYAKALADDFYAACLLELRGRIFTLLKQYFQHHSEQIRHPNPNVAIDFSLRQAVAMLSARIEAGRLEVGEGAISDALFVRELIRSILSYLQVPYTAAAIDKALTVRGL